LYDDGKETRSREFNMLQYLKYAPRRETNPIKIHHYPYTHTSYMTGVGVGMLFPDYFQSSYAAPLFAKMAQYGRENADRPKGMTCVMFVLSCLAAVAFEREVRPVSDKTGWVSIKYSSLPADKSSELYAVLSRVKAEIQAPECEGPGLQDVMTGDFDMDNLVEKWGASLADINPQRAFPREFFQALMKDEVNWKRLGAVDKTERHEFDRERIHEDGCKIRMNTVKNLTDFVGKFGVGLFNRVPGRQRTVSIAYQEEIEHHTRYKMQ
jgi:hypothetical protein